MFRSSLGSVEVSKSSKVLSSLLMAVIVAAIYSHPYFIWSVPPVWLLLIAAAILTVRIREIPVLASLFFLLGAATIIWSLTPANTLLNTLWETTYLAALAVGGGIGGFAVLNSWLVLIGLERTLLLDLFNLSHYFSGSAHYLAGAQALLFIPFCFKTAVASEKWAIRLAATLAAAACLVLILNSGARAVYWPAIGVLVVTLLRIVVTTGERVWAFTAPAVALTAALSFAAVLPGPTVWVPLGMKAVALDVRADASPESEAPESSTSAVSEEGGIGSRLKMWDQAIRIGVDHPLGTGTGSFRNTIHAFQRYPLVGFSSAHNVFIEVFATGGWLRVLVLIALLSASLWSGWNSSRWPVAVGAAGLWATMSFDITGQMPGVMVLGFWALGTSWPSRAEASNLTRLSPRTALAAGSLLVGIAALAWWYLPCDARECATGRHLGYRMEVTRAAVGLQPDEAIQLADEALELNPESLWAWRLWSAQAVGAEAKLAASRAVAQKFPLASPELYLRWAEDALAANQPSEARRAIQAGLESFPEDLNPAGVPFGGRGVQYGNWLVSAREILEGTGEGQ